MKNDVQLRHDPIAIDFRYLAKNDADVGDWRSVVGHANTIDGDLTDPTGVYAAIGPSATWKIELLDLVTALRGTRPQVPAAQLVAVTGTVTTFDGLTIKITPDAGTAVTFDVTKGDIDLTGIETGSKVEAEGVKDVAGKAHPALKWLKDRSNTIINPTGLSAIDFEFFIYYDSDTHIK